MSVGDASEENWRSRGLVELEKHDFAASAAILRPQRYITDLITCFYTVNGSTRAPEARAKKICPLEGF